MNVNPIKLEWPQGTHQIFVDIVEQCLARNPEQRPSIKQIRMTLDKFRTANVYTPIGQSSSSSSELPFQPQGPRDRDLIPIPV